ncbi:MAG TPA: hypothetical protein VH643_38135 [Gemmataceae bacterium]|jgi:hypothetical protein
MTRKAIIQWVKVQPPQVAFLDDGCCFRPAEAQKWLDSPDEPARELYRLPGTTPTWVLVDSVLFWLKLPCGGRVSDAEAATFLLQNGHEIPEELRAAAESLHLVRAKSGSAKVVPAPRPLQPSLDATEARHSEDFRWVKWFGTVFTFTPVQAACVRVLWEAWQHQTPEVGQETILMKAGAESKRLSDIFKRHAAWRTMIVPGSTRGAYMLAQPRR